MKTFNETKHWLNRGFKLQPEKKNIIDEIEMIRNGMTSIKAIDYSADIVQHSVGNGFAEKLDGDIERISALEDRLGRLSATEKEIAEAIDKLADSKRRAVLNWRYVQFLKFDEIAEKMSYDVRQVYRIHDCGINDVSECQFHM